MNDLISNKIQIETETVSTKDGKRTYSITRRIVGMDESRAVMVMLYPTRSALKMNVDDSTFFHLTQHLPELGISELTVINLFSKVCRARMSTANLECAIKYHSNGCLAIVADWVISDFEQPQSFIIEALSGFDKGTQAYLREWLENK